MARKPCTSCGAVSRNKPASVYASWFDGDTRIAHRLIVCFDCVVAHVAPYVKRANADVRGAKCHDCGVSANGTASPLWFTVYMPGMPEEQFDLRFCPDCSGAVREDLVNRSTGTPLPDRQGAGGRQPLESAAWDGVW